MQLRVFNRENQIGGKHLSAEWIARLIFSSEIKVPNLKEAIEEESKGSILLYWIKLTENN